MKYKILVTLAVVLLAVGIPFLKSKQAQNSPVSPIIPEISSKLPENVEKKPVLVKVSTPPEIPKVSHETVPVLPIANIFANQDPAPIIPIIEVTTGVAYVENQNSLNPIFITPLTLTNNSDANVSLKNASLNIFPQWGVSFKEGSVLEITDNGQSQLSIQADTEMQYTFSNSITIPANSNKTIYVKVSKLQLDTVGEGNVVIKMKSIESLNQAVFTFK